MTRQPVDILLVDDEARNLDALEATLDDPAYRLLRADSAEKALKTLLDHDVAAIVLDIKMPGVSGVELARMIKNTKRFVPASNPGGQPLDAVVLLTTYLWQTEHLAPSLQREVRELAETAVAAGQMGALEDFYLDILTLGKRLNWVQLSEFLRTATSTGTVAQFAHLTRVAPEHLSVIYTAALMTRARRAPRGPQTAGTGGSPAPRSRSGRRAERGGSPSPRSRRRSPDPPAACASRWSGRRGFRPRPAPGRTAPDTVPQARSPGIQEASKGPGASAVGTARLISGSVRERVPVVELRSSGRRPN